jgi:GT2 family glycosyltransferase
VVVFTLPPRRAYSRHHWLAVGSDDAGEAETRYPSCTILRIQSNPGYAAAMNAGAARLIGPVDNIFFPTHEVVMEPYWTAPLTSPYRTIPDVRIGTGRDGADISCLR